jgi:hypothetical protein
MFRQDVNDRILPYSWNRDEDAYQAKIVGEDKEVEIATSVLRTISRGTRYADKDLIASTLRELCLALTWNGKAYFEILNSQTTRAFGLAYIPPRRAALLPFWLVQFVGKGAREQGKPQFICVPRSSIWAIEMPFSLGGVRGYRKMLRALNRSSAISSQHLLDSSSRRTFAGIRISYDFSLHMYIEHVQRTVSTRSWGWHQRNYEARDITEYYFFFHQLKFARSIAVLREHLVCEVNKLFKMLGVKAAIELNGLLRPHEFDVLLHRMWEGNLNFTEASEIATQPIRRHADGKHE